MATERRAKRVTLAVAAIALGLAANVAPAAQVNKSNEPQKRLVVLRGRLAGAAGAFTVVTWQTTHHSNDRREAHMSVETTGPKPRVLIQVDGGREYTSISSFILSDLDGDGSPEVLSLWWRGTQPGESPGAALRVFRSEGQQFAEAELREPVVGVRSYRVSSRSVMVFKTLASHGVKAAGVFRLNGAVLQRADGGEPVTAGESGIEGQCLISPIHPGPTRMGQPNTAPYKTTIVVTRESDSREMARVETGDDGRFRVSLPPGDYRVGAGELKRLPRAQEESVKVVAGTFAKVTINFDSGMR